MIRPRPLTCSGVEHRRITPSYDDLCRLYDAAQRATGELAAAAPHHVGQEVVAKVAARCWADLDDHRHHLGEQFGGWSE